MRQSLTLHEPQEQLSQLEQPQVVQSLEGYVSSCS
jgi:hypothetical protein